MAMFKWGAMYINPEEVAAIFVSKDGTVGHPFYMTVHLKDGKEYKTNYATESGRDKDAARLAREIDRMQVEPVTRYQIEELIDKAKSAIRRDIKALREDLKEADGK